MTINIDDLRTQELRQKGSITNGTDLANAGSSSDIAGTFTNGYFVTGLRGRTLNNSNPLQEGEGYIRQVGTTDLRPTALVYTTRETLGGNVTGTFDAGLNLQSIYNGGVEGSETFVNNGEGLVFDGDHLVPVQLNPSRQSYVTSATFSAVHRDKLFIDTSSNAVVITPPSSPNPGDFFEVYFLKGNAATNDCTVSITPSFNFGSLGSVMFVYMTDAWVAQNLGAPQP
ncbi:hypothetical protein AB832_08155 [Flavobacteriaceae bacterium (ex Bugula neritina AB1)]|jgi:hypothetical protein|nr:hypothetical protein AB832_08155 [Flavobacteriaceae bacterium (ex Bugula neritina AB1)]